MSEKVKGAVGTAHPELGCDGPPMAAQTLAKFLRGVYGDAALQEADRRLHGPATIDKEARQLWGAAKEILAASRSPASARRHD